MYMLNEPRGHQVLKLTNDGPCLQFQTGPHLHTSANLILNCQSIQLPQPLTTSYSAAYHTYPYCVVGAGEINGHEYNYAN